MDTEKAICPYCNNIDQDSWELQSDEAGFEGGGNTWCGSCGKEFYFYRHVKTNYTTKKVEDL